MYVYIVVCSVVLYHVTCNLVLCCLFCFVLDFRLHEHKHRFVVIFTSHGRHIRTVLGGWSLSSSLENLASFFSASSKSACIAMRETGHGFVIYVGFTGFRQEREDHEDIMGYHEDIMRIWDGIISCHGI